MYPESILNEIELKLISRSTHDHNNSLNSELFFWFFMSQFEELIKKAYDVKVDKVGTKKVSLNIRWLDVKGAIKSDNVVLREGDHIEF